MKITNNTGISLTLAVWAVNDDYDLISTPNYISVTTLMKPLRQIILASRLPANLKDKLDVTDLIASAWGSALHGSIEGAWANGKYKVNLAKLGYPQHQIDRIKINPEPSELTEDTIAVYIEQRGFKVVGKWTVGGKFDFCADGILQDNKSTSAFTWLYGSNDSNYKLQGSLYRWIHSDKVTEDYIRINYLFTDWSKKDARANPKYPQKRLEYKDIPLMLIDDTQKWVENKLSQLDRYWNTPERQLPECTDEELWREAPRYKYYSNAAKTDGRSTKNFDTLAEANGFLSSKGGVGVVKTVPGKVKRCGYCSAFPICTQQLKYEHD